MGSTRAVPSLTRQMNLSDRELIVLLCHDALADRLDIRQLWPRVPPDLSHPLLALIVDDIENVVEHSPGRERDVYWTTFVKMHEFRTLVLDMLVLDSAADLDRAQRLRDSVLKALPLTRLEIEAAVQRQLAYE